MSTTINISHLYRVEGHGGIKIVVGDQGIESCQMNIFEGTRFYEALLRGRPYQEAPGIVCRVCAICTSGHTLCSIGALEDAMGIGVDPIVRKLRNLLNLGQWIESHALHLFCLAVPDYIGQTSVLGMLQTHPIEVKKALAIKRIGNVIQEVVGGRAVHPVNMIVGGMGKCPDAERLGTLSLELDECLRQAVSLEGLITALPNPDMGLPTPIFVALRGDGTEYPLTGDKIAASGFDDIPVSEFRSRINELVVRHSTAKQSLYASQPFMVGSVARLHHSADLLAGEAKAMWERVAPKKLTSLDNNLAQYIELVWALEMARNLAEDLGRTCAAPADTDFPPLIDTKGHAALEVPRGTLHHAYEIDDQGLISDVDIVTPTAQNLASIEQDFAAAAEFWVKSYSRDEGKIRGNLEMIARAYDPCISCSTHLLDLLDITVKH